MKYGLLYYKDTDNIGDDIQSYAASRFLPRIDYMIDRENIESFAPEKKEYVYTIMNAWYIHDKYNFNFSPYIYPLFISMFFKNFPYEDGIMYGIDYLNDNVIADLKEHSPVGARDIHTKKIFDKLGIENYFSGCLTLTIEKFSDVKKGDYIVVVGLNNDEINYIKSKTNRPIKIIKQDVKRGIFSGETWEVRKQRVIDLLKIYQGAHMVITNKLHCSLPCLALETPVLLLYDKSFPENKDRIGTYLDYLNYIDRNKLKNINIDFDNPKNNPNKYLKIRKQIIKKCQDFVLNKEEKSFNELPDIDEYIDGIKRAIISRKPIIKNLKKTAKKYVKKCQDISNMEYEINDLKYQYDILKDRHDKLVDRIATIENSRSYKFCIKLSSVLKKLKIKK